MGMWRRTVETFLAKPKPLPEPSITMFLFTLEDYHFADHLAPAATGGQLTRSAPRFRHK